MDQERRRLERLAASGDTDAIRKLAQARLRGGSSALQRATEDYTELQGIFAPDLTSTLMITAPQVSDPMHRPTPIQFITKPFISVAYDLRLRINRLRVAHISFYYPSIDAVNHGIVNEYYTVTPYIGREANYELHDILGRIHPLIVHKRHVHTSGGLPDIPKNESKPWASLLGD